MREKKELFRRFRTESDSAWESIRSQLMIRKYGGREQQEDGGISKSQGKTVQCANLFLMKMFRSAASGTEQTFNYSSAHNAR